LPASFDDIEIGQVASLGAAAVDPTALEAFCKAFTPGWTIDRGAPDAMVFAIWARLDAVASTDWPQTKRLGVDALRWMRNPPAGELLRARMTVMAKDPVGDDKRHDQKCPHDLPGQGRLISRCDLGPQFLRGYGGQAHGLSRCGHATDNALAQVGRPFQIQCAQPRGGLRIGMMKRGQAQPIPVAQEDDAVLAQHLAAFRQELIQYLRDVK